MRHSSAVIPEVARPVGTEGAAGASFAAEEASVAKWFCGGDGSRSKSSRGLSSWKERGVLGEENGEGEVLEVPDWPGWWRRQELPEMRKKALLGRLAS